METKDKITIWKEKLFRMRTERLAQCAEINAPATITLSELALCVSSCVKLYGAKAVEEALVKRSELEKQLKENP